MYRDPSTQKFRRATTRPRTVMLSRAARSHLVGLVLLVGCTHPSVPSPREAPPAAARLVSFPALDGVELHGFLYLPSGAGPFPAVLWNHGSERFPGWQPGLAEYYTANGFAFFLPHRRGQGRSSAAGAYILDRQPSKLRVVTSPTASGREVIALHEEASRDVEAALAWLKARPEVDAQRIVMSGVSFGGIQTLLAAEKGQGVRAFVAFAPGAMSWRWVQGLKGRLEQAVREAKAPVLIVQAENDYDLSPSRALGPALEQAGKGRSVVFPAYGTSAQDGHGGFACRPEGTALWGPTVLGFFRGAIAR